MATVFRPRIVLLSHVFSGIAAAQFVGCGPSSDPADSARTQYPATAIEAREDPSQLQPVTPDPNSIPLAVTILELDAEDHIAQFEKERHGERARRDQVDRWLTQFESTVEGADVAQPLASQCREDWSLIATAPLTEVLSEKRKTLLQAGFAMRPDSETSSKLRRAVAVARASDPAAGRSLLQWAKTLPQGSAMALAICRSVQEASQFAEVQVEAGNALHAQEETAKRTFRQSLSRESADLFEKSLASAAEMGPAACESLLIELQIDLIKAEGSSSEALNSIERSRDNPYRTRRNEVYREAFENRQLEGARAAQRQQRDLQDAVDALLIARRTRMNALMRDYRMVWPQLPIAAVTNEDDFNAAVGIAAECSDRQLYRAAAEYHEVAVQLAMVAGLGLTPIEEANCRRFACRMKIMPDDALRSLREFISNSTTPELIAQAPRTLATLEYLYSDIATYFERADEAAHHDEIAQRLTSAEEGDAASMVPNWLRLARIWLEVDEAPLAIRSLRRCRPLLNTLKTGSPRLATETLVLDARAQLLLDNSKEATAKALQAVELCSGFSEEEPLIVESRLTLAKAFRDNRDFKAAEGAFKDLRALHMTTASERRRSRTANLAWSDFDHELGLLRLQEGRFVEAAALFRSALAVRLERLGGTSRRTAASEAALIEATRTQTGSRS